MKGHIRAYRAEDTDVVVAVWAAASAVAHPFLDAGFVRREQDRVRNQYLRVAETWVFARDSRILGFIAMIGDEVGGIFVHPDAQRRGIGRALMDFVVERRGEVFLDVFKSNSRGRTFYDRYGFATEYEHLHEETGEPQLRLRYPPAPQAGRG